MKFGFELLNKNLLGSFATQSEISGQYGNNNNNNGNNNNDDDDDDDDNNKNNNNNKIVTVTTGSIRADTPHTSIGHLFLWTQMVLFLQFFTQIQTSQEEYRQYSRRQSSTAKYSQHSRLN